jgi:hypothetical protein
MLLFGVVCVVWQKFCDALEECSASVFGIEEIPEDGDSTLFPKFGKLGRDCSAVFHRSLQSEVAVCVVTKTDFT